MKKTNKELNQAFDQKQADKVRPSLPSYNFKPLEEVVSRWVKAGM
jgi:hypothetical protein